MLPGATPANLTGKKKGAVELRGRVGQEERCCNSADAKNEKNNGNRYRSETFFWSFIKPILFSHLSLSLEHVCQVKKKSYKKSWIALHFPRKMCWPSIFCLRSTIWLLNWRWIRKQPLDKAASQLRRLWISHSGKGWHNCSAPALWLAFSHICPMTPLPKWKLNNSGNWTLTAPSFVLVRK